jgi:hypothetical protein
MQFSGPGQDDPDLIDARAGNLSLDKAFLRIIAQVLEVAVTIISPAFHVGRPIGRAFSYGVDSQLKHAQCLVFAMICTWAVPILDIIQQVLIVSQLFAR